MRLPDSTAPLNYKAALTLDPAKDTFAGKIEIQIEVKQPVDTIWLNASKLTVSSARLKIGDKTLNAAPIEGGKDFIGLKFDSSVAAGKGELEIVYTGVVQKQDSSGIFFMEDDGNKYLYTQFESTEARAAFPCFDEPSYKVPWQLTLTIPDSATAVSNTAIAKQKTQAGQTTYTFGRTKPLPSYLIAFGVGPFDYVDAGTAGKNKIPVRIVTPKGHAGEAKFAAQVTAEIITRLEAYFGIPFPYDKSDQLSIPLTFGFGAMENAGLVTYGQTIILSKPSVDTVGRQRGYVSTAAHELAHQWFGDLVTTAWCNDIWLNEAFATWMEQKLVREWKPEWNTNVGDVSSKLYAQRQDSLPSSRKIRQEILAKDDISNAFDGITYSKGASVIGMFEDWVGPDIFRQGVKSYLTRYAFRNASAPEFLDAISSAGGKNVNQAFSSFLNQAGIPLISVALDCSHASPTLHLEQQRFVPLGSKAPDQTWQIPVCVRYGSGTQGESACELMTQPKQDMVLKTASCPSWVEANDKALGYYAVDYKGGLLDALTEGDVRQRLSAPERTDFMGNASSLADVGKLSSGDALSLVPVFASDPERHVVQSALRLAQLFRTHGIPDSLLPNYRRFLLKNFQARARRIGWTPQAGEGDDVSLLRPSLLPLVATQGEDQQLADQAKVLADQWLANHSAVNPNLATAALATTAFYGDKAFFDRLIVSLNATKDRQERQRIIGSMTAFRDPEAINAAFNALLTGKVPFMEGYFLLFQGGDSDATRKLPLAFLAAHYDEILAKAPTGGGDDLGGSLPFVGGSYCDEASKTQLKDFFATRVDKLLGARRYLDQVLESIDICIAQTAQQKPGIKAFLQKY